MRSILRLAVSAALAFAVHATAQVTPIAMDAFESYADGEALDGRNGWSLFAQETQPQAVVVEGEGVEGGKALALWGEQKYRRDYMGLTLKLAEPADGIVWVRCKFRPPKGDWMSGFMLKTELASIWASFVEAKEDEEAEVRFVAPYWRGYRANRRFPFDPNRWHEVDFRLDFNSGRVGVWVDGKVFMENHRIETDVKALESVYVCAGGTKDAPAFIDDVVVTREAPDWFVERPWLPPKQEGLLLRFAAVQDPQLGFPVGRYVHDVWATGEVVRQINEAEADVSIFLGDMVHQDDNEDACRELKETLDGLDAPWLAVRGNHDKPELFTKYFAEALDHSSVHKGFRFVAIHAIGKEEPLPDDQLAWIEGEFRAAKEAGQTVFVGIHVSPWDDNERGRGAYNRIGEGKDRLVALLEQYGVPLVMSGHYHRAVWHHERAGVNYLIPAGPTMIRIGPSGFCLVDVYADRIVVHTKQIVAPYDTEETEEYFQMPTLTWHAYEDLLQQFPYAVHGPLTIEKK